MKTLFKIIIKMIIWIPLWFCITYPFFLSFPKLNPLLFLGIIICGVMVYIQIDKYVDKILE